MMSNTVSERQLAAHVRRPGQVYHCLPKLEGPWFAGLRNAAQARIASEAGGVQQHHLPADMPHAFCCIIKYECLAAAFASIAKHVRVTCSFSLCNAA